MLTLFTISKPCAITLYVTHYNGYLATLQLLRILSCNGRNTSVSKDVYGGEGRGSRNQGVVTGL